MHHVKHFNSSPKQKESFHTDLVYVAITEKMPVNENGNSDVNRRGYQIPKPL